MKSWSFMSGWKKMVCRVSACVLLLFSISSLCAEERISDAQQTTIPSIDFLEFLGEWETEQGEWIDLETLEDNEIGKILEINTDNEN